MTEGTPYPPQQPGQPDQPGQPGPANPTPPGGGYPPPGTPPPAAGYPPPGQPGQPYAQPGQPAQPYAQPGQPAQPYAPYQAPAQQPYQQPGVPYQAPATPKKKGGAKKILLILALVIGVPLLGIGACTAFFVKTIKAPANASNEFIAHLDNQEYGEAFDQFDPSCVDGFTEADLRSSWSNVVIDDYNLNNVNIVNSTADVSGTISLDGGAPEPISFSLQKNDGTWEVCEFEVR